MSYALAASFSTISRSSLISFILRFYLLLQCFDIRTFSLNGFRSTLSHFEGNAGIHHVFTSSFRAKQEILFVGDS